MNNKTFKILSLNGQVEFIIQGICTENEVFENISMINVMKSYVSLSLNQFFVTKISPKDYQFAIDILIDSNNKDSTVNMLKNKGFKFLNDTPKENKTIKHSLLDKDTSSKKKIIYTEEYHFDKCTDEVINIYHTLKNRILSQYEDVNVVPNKTTIKFTTKNHNIINLEFQKKALLIWFNTKQGTLNDPLRKTRDVSTIGHHGSGDYEIKIQRKESIDYLMDLFEQVYSNKKLIT